MGLDNPLHIAFLLVVMLMVFGAKRLPEMGKSLGTGLRGFKESLNTDAPPSALAMGEHPEPVAVPVAVPVPVPVPVAEHHSTERAAA